MFATLDVLLGGFDGLVQAGAPLATFRGPAGELVDDDHFAVFDDVIDIALENCVGFERLLHVMERIDLARIVKVVHAKEPLHFGNPALGQCHRSALLIDRVIAFGIDGSALLL